MKIDKQEFLTVLEGTKVGLTQKEVIEQSHNFVFKNGRIYTFNDEVCCSGKTDIDIEGSVLGPPLLEVLRKLPDDELKVEVADGEFVLRGRKKTIAIPMEKEIFLPINSVEDAGKWKKLDPQFLEAIDLVRQCTETDRTKVALTCVRMCPDFIEAFDNYQLCRWNVSTGVDEEVLIKNETAKAIVQLGVTRVSLSPQWIHYWNKETDIILSARRYFEEYRDLGPYLKRTGEKASFPKGLADSVDVSTLFAADNSADDKDVLSVDIRPGKVRISASGMSGRYEEVKNVKYKGPSFSFRIHAKIFASVVSRFEEVYLTDKMLYVDGGSFTFVARLSMPK